MSKRKYGKVFLQGQEPNTIVKQCLVLSNWASPNELADQLGLEQLEW